MEITKTAFEQGFEHADEYERRSVKLGDSFLDALFLAYEGIEKNPYRWQIVEGNVRRALVKKFPFSVFYFIEEEKVIILAVIHQSANPKDWPSRS